MKKKLEEMTHAHVVVEKNTKNVVRINENAVNIQLTDYDGFL